VFFSEIKQIEINPTELCNLACNFCPRSTFYPNLNEHMSLDVAREIRDQMLAAKFSGVLSITGRGEPTLHPQFEEYVSIFVGYSWSLKMHTNGKRFEQYEDFILKNFNDVHYNCYDCNAYDVWQKYGHYKNVKVIDKPITSEWKDLDWTTNRAGSFRTNELPEDTTCDVIFHKMFIDIDGKYRLCCEDWKHKIVMQNIFQVNIVDYIEDSPLLKIYRRNLIDGDRVMNPCINCNYNISCDKYGRKQDMAKYKKMVEIENL
jgi:hypothetical protein